MPSNPPSSLPPKGSAPEKLASSLPGLMIRMLWILATPFVAIANRIGLCSYEWVNVCVGARRPDLFNPLWHHQRYGTPIRVLPESVILCGIEYTASSHEGIVTFSDPFLKRRISFERDEIENEALWYLDLAGGTVPAPHVQSAYDWTCAVFGGSFETRGATR